MPGLRVDYHGMNIFGKDEFMAKFPVEHKIKIMLGMLTGYSFQVLVGKPPYAFKFSCD